MLRTTRLTSLSFEPVTLAEAKAHLRVDIADDDALITRLITTARVYCEEHCDNTFVGGTFQGFEDEFPLGSEPFSIPKPPLTGVASISYVDETNVSRTLLTAALLVDSASRPGRIYPAFGTTWPRARAERGVVRIEYSAGPASAAEVDPRAKQAMLLLVGHWYANREAVLSGTISKEIELAVVNLLAQLDTGVYA